MSAAATPAASAPLDEQAELEALDVLQAQLRELAGERARAHLLLCRLRHNAAVTNAVFPAGAVHSAQRTLRELCAARDAVTERYLKLHSDVRGLEEDLRAQRQRSHTLMVANRETMAALDAAKQAHAASSAGAAAAAATPSRRTRLADELARNAIIKNVFQAIVVSSGVDWAADPALLRVVLQLEQPAP